MTRETIVTAIREGIPFAISMADGRQYPVPDQLAIALGPTNVVVIDDRGQAHVLPLLTMTGVTYLPKENGSAKS